MLSIFLQKSERYTHTHVEKWRSRKPLSVSVSLSLDFIGAVRASEDFFRSRVLTFSRKDVTRGWYRGGGRELGRFSATTLLFSVAVSPSLKAIIFVLSIFLSLSLERERAWDGGLFVVVGVCVQVSF